MSSLDEEIIYEEDEVVWAKIRGYPWWPAFIDKLGMERGEHEYTVFFFGDNTHAKLGPLKLRKFIDYYTTHYLTAKTNRKLMAAIHSAEEKLNQNHQNIQIFKELRDSLKNYKEKPHLEHLGSNPSYPEDSDHQPRMPRLIKSKTSFSKPRKHMYESQSEPGQSQLEIESQDKSEIVPRRQGSMLKAQREITKLVSVPAKKEQIFQQEQSENSEGDKQLEKGQFMQEEEANVKREYDQMKEESLPVEESQEDEAAIEDDKEEQFGATRKRGGRVIQQAPRRRGRPKKSTKPNEDVLRFPVKTDKRKMINKLSLELKSSPSKNFKMNKPSDEDIIEKVKSLLDLREELVEYLDTIKITPSNAKEILDLDVANILQAGPMDYKIRTILNLLKSSLLLLYFPDDTKNMKHYQKLARGKSTHSEPLKHEKSKELSESDCSSMDIRKKTMIKLQKFLKTHPEVDSKAKELALKIEAYFQKADNKVGKRYKTIAYKVLSNLKDKKETFQEVMSKLDANAYD